MWLEELERRVLGALWRLRLIVEAMRDFFGKLASLEHADFGDRGALSEQASDGPVGPPRLAAGRRTYVVTGKIAAGDLCDVYLATREGQRYLVKTPRVIHPAADAVMAKEFHILRQLVEEAGDRHHAQYYPRPVESLAGEGRRPRSNVFAWEDGFYTAGEIVTRYPDGVTGRHLAWMFKRMLAALGHAHRQGWINGAALPPHLLFHAENHGLHLGGWIHAVRPGEPLTIVPAAFKAWYPPEARFRADTATDIYLAAKSLVYLAGGNPATDELPHTAPAPMRSFLQACLLESPRMRPADAWQLHDEFDDLLVDLYGPPQYVVLTMN